MRWYSYIMNKDQALKIHQKNNKYYLRSYKKEDNQIILISETGPYSIELARRLKKSSKRKRKERRKRIFINESKNIPCLDCGEKKTRNKMTFDHVRGKKNFGIASGSGKTWRQLTEEIAKCEIVCRTCHNIREFFRGRMRLHTNDLASLLFRFI